MAIQYTELDLLGGSPPDGKEVFRRFKNVSSSYKAIDRAYTYADDPIQFAIDALEYAEGLVGQDKKLEFAAMALKEYRAINP